MQNLRGRRLQALRVPRGRGKRSFGVVVAAVVSVVACLALTTGSALASGGQNEFHCKDSNGTTYVSDGGVHVRGLGGYWYAQMSTGSGNYDHNTLGAKADITTAGIPYVPDVYHQHVLVHLTSDEDGYHWIQVGWNVGLTSENQCTSYDYPSIPEVHLEIFDNTSPTDCTEASYGNAPSDASYDARYYGQDGNYYQYRAFYQAPGSSTIQYLGWGDFTNQYTAEITGGEVLGSTDPSTYPQCPYLSQPGYPYNQIGYPPSSTFASIVQLWNGSGWYNWTPSSVPDTSFLIEAPYHLNVLNSYTQLTVGGQ
jgi:hypothetical protein